MNALLSTIDIYHLDSRATPESSDRPDSALDQRKLSSICEAALTVLNGAAGKLTAECGARLISAGIRADVVVAARRRDDGSQWLRKRIDEIKPRKNSDHPAPGADVDEPLRVAALDPAGEGRLKALYDEYVELTNGSWAASPCDETFSAFVVERAATAWVAEQLKARPQHGDFRRVEATVYARPCAQSQVRAATGRITMTHGNASLTVQLAFYPSSSTSVSGHGLRTACGRWLPTILNFALGRVGAFPTAEEFAAWVNGKSTTDILDRIALCWDVISQDQARKAEITRYLSTAVTKINDDAAVGAALWRIEQLPGRPQEWSAPIRNAVRHALDSLLDTATGHLPEVLLKWLSWYPPEQHQCDRLVELGASAHDADSWRDVLSRAVAGRPAPTPGVAGPAFRRLLDRGVIDHGDVQSWLRWLRLLRPDLATLVDHLLCFVRGGLNVERLPSALADAMTGTSEPLEEVFREQVRVLAARHPPAALTPAQTAVWNDLCKAI